MSEIAVVIIAVVVIISAGFLIPVLIEFRKTMKRLNEFLDTTGKELPPAIDELKQTLESLKTISEDIQSVTGGVREIADVLTDTADNLRSVSSVISRVGNETNAVIAGLKTGVKTAIGVFVKNLLHKGG
ncbi:hypothetical protein MNBD_NITROSPIRAE02-284 [hydrothermal vent metagenome]|uniref:DUF948 domain-containing protein n=1 Tax=hydrothermal vent metagenome TaxID=652676 RepID=A0A3B1CQF3_9ZZZZ